jgi:hypothetical protein
LSELIAYYASALPRELALSVPRQQKPQLEQQGPGCSEPLRLSARLTNSSGAGILPFLCTELFESAEVIVLVAVRPQLPTSQLGFPFSKPDKFALTAFCERAASRQGDYVRVEDDQFLYQEQQEFLHIA